MAGAGTISGAGLGLRTPHFDDLLCEQRDNLWLELLADNWLYGGLTRRYLDAFIEKYPLTLHSVGLSIGSCDPLDMDYLNALKKLLKITKSPWLSDHLCFTSIHNHHFPDLLPLPYNEESVQHVTERIGIIQDTLGIQILIENVSSYVEYKESVLSEAEFISAICRESGCALLLDLNNIYVSERNLGYDSWETIKNLPLDHVKEIHLAGFSDKVTHVVDTHDNPVHKDVWQLLDKILPRVQDTPVLIEWDNCIPELSVLLSEVQKARVRIDAARNEKDIDEKKGSHYALV